MCSLAFPTSRAGDLTPEEHSSAWVGSAHTEGPKETIASSVLSVLIFCGDAQPLQSHTFIELCCSVLGCMTYGENQFQEPWRYCICMSCTCDVLSLEKKEQCSSVHRTYANQLHSSGTNEDNVFIV